MDGNISALSKRSEATTPESLPGPQPPPTASDQAKEYTRSLASDLQGSNPDLTDREEGADVPDIPEGTSSQTVLDSDKLPDDELEGASSKERVSTEIDNAVSPEVFSLFAESILGSNEMSGMLLNGRVTFDKLLVNPQALCFIENIDESDYEHLLFNDTLITCSDTGKELGEFEVSLSPAFNQGRECFLLHANSHGAIDNIPCGTSIMAYVTKNLETLEQHHHEYVKLANHPLDRKTHIVKQTDNYTVTRVISQGEDVQRKTHTFTHEEMVGFISEGSNLLLQRLLMMNGIPDNFQLISFDSDANLCPVIYRSLPMKTQIIQETEVETFGIERTINSAVDLPTTWQSYFMEDGHLTSRVQVGSPVTMRLVTLPPAIPIEEEIERPTFEKKDLDWEDDMELHSKYLDKKEELKADYAYYMRKHPELKAMLADFVQFLLLRKPTDTIAFAADYFSSFSSKIPSGKPFKESGEPARYPHNCLNPKIEHLMKILS